MKKWIGLAVAMLVFGSVGGAGAVTIDLVSEEGITAWGPVYLIDQSAPLTGTDWGDPGTAVATWVHGSWPTLLGATWVSTAYYVEDAVVDSWRRFQTTFVIPNSALILPGSMTIATSDNAEQFFLNGVLVGSDGAVTGDFTDNYEWNTLLTYNFTPVIGNNTLDFIVRNYAMSGGTTTSNPTGLLFSARVDYSVPEPGTLLLLGSGLTGLALIRRKRRVPQD